MEKNPNAPPCEQKHIKLITKNDLPFEQTQTQILNLSRLPAAPHSAQLCKKGTDDDKGTSC